MTADTCFYTPPEIVVKLRVKADEVASWIRFGELRVINVALAGCRRASVR